MTKGSGARLGLLALLWGSNFLLIRLALEGLSPFAVVAARMLLGAAVLLAVVRAQGLRLPTRGAVWAHLAVAALVASVLPYFLFAWAELTVPSHVAGALNATTPLFTLGIAVAVGQEARPGRWRLAGLVLGLVGAVMVLTPWRQDGPGDGLAGEVACLAAAASYGLSYVYMRRYLIGRGLAPLVLAAAQLIAGCLILVPLTPLLTAGTAGTAGTADVTPAVLASVVALGALGTGGAYILNYRLIHDEGATSASTVTYLLPVVAVVLGAAVGGEPVTWSLLVGAVTVLVGVALAEGRLGHAQRPQRAARGTAGRSPVGKV